MITPYEVSAVTNGELAKKAAAAALSGGGGGSPIGLNGKKRRKGTDLKPIVTEDEKTPEERDAPLQILETTPG